MCQNKEVSILSWFGALISSLYLFFRGNPGDIWVGTFTLAFTQMQVLEALIWSTNKKEKFFNNLLPSALWSQPLVASIFLYQSGLQNELVLSAIIAYSLIFILSLYNKTSVDINVGPNGHLVWERKDKYGILGGTAEFNNNILNILYLLGVFVPFLYLNSSAKLPLLAFGIGSFIYTRNYYPEEANTLWCWISVILPLIQITFG